jgi:hypothetical protein
MKKTESKKKWDGVRNKKCKHKYLSEIVNEINPFRLLSTHTGYKLKLIYCKYSKVRARSMWPRF